MLLQNTFEAENLEWTSTGRLVKRSNMIAEYEIRFMIPDIGRAPDNFRELLNILEKLGMIDHLVKVEESTEYDLSKSYYSVSRKALFALVNKGE